MGRPLSMDLRRLTRQGRIDPGRLVFIDETSAILRQAQDKYGAVAGSARPAPAGQVRYGHGKTMTFLAALRATASMRHGCSTGQSVARASGSMLSVCWSRRWH